MATKNTIGTRIGDKIGRWTVAGEPLRKDGILFIPCKCECGVERDISSCSLLSGRTRSCGCYQKDKMRLRPQCGGNTVDRIGHRYGRLQVIARAGTKGTAASWVCLCDCGNKRIVTSNALRDRCVRSCGCARRTGKNSRTHYKWRLPAGESAKRSLLKQYRGSARAKGVVWGLTDEEFYSIIASPCFYCGDAPSRIRKVSKNGHIVFNGIDRADNIIGYTLGNSVACCHLCNHAKCTMTQGDFMDWIKRIYSHWENQGWRVTTNNRELF